MEYLESQNLNKGTVKTHVRNLERFAAVGSSQKLIIKKLDLLETWPRRLSAANSLSKWLQFKQSPNDQIVKYIHEANAEIQKEAEIRQKDMALDDTLPSLKEMKAHTNSLFENGNYRGYAIMYLFLTYTLRNMDLVATVVKSKKDTNSTDNFFIVGKNQVIYLRNAYKTADKYGLKSHIIKSKKFHTAISKLNYLLKPTDNIDRVVKNITAGIGHITQSTITKIVLRESNTINGLKKISKNRGTDISTLIHSYNITKK
jgi:hypothetical protein